MANDSYVESDATSDKIDYSEVTTTKGTVKRQRVTLGLDSGELPSSLPVNDNSSDHTIFGQAVVASRISQIVAEFDLPLASNAVTATVTNSGAVAQADGKVTLTTGTHVSGTAKLATDRNLRYSPNREIYCVFTAYFTTPTSADSHQRGGLYDTNNGFFVGFQGTTFGITFRSRAVDTFIPRTSWNGDLLDGGTASKFTRAAVAEAFDTTKLNIFRIRLGWLGTAPILFEILCPDGHWVIFHSIRQPNLIAGTSIASPNLPITMEAIKASADATSLVVGTGSWDAGTVDDPAIYAIEDVRGRTHVQAALAGQAADATLYTVSSGRLLKVASVMLTVHNSSTTNVGLLELRDGSSGTIVLPVTIPSGNTTSAAQITVALTLTIPLRFSTAVYCDVISGTLTYSVAITGYELEALV